jgi:hypothetical protein
MTTSWQSRFYLRCRFFSSSRLVYIQRYIVNIVWYYPLGDFHFFGQQTETGTATHKAKRLS